MKKYDLLQSDDSIIRVLVVQGDRVLIIDCIKRTMPVWIELDTLESYSECTYGELSEATGIVIVSVDDLDADQRKTMYERYTMIAPILPFLADDRMRSRIICSVAILSPEQEAAKRRELEQQLYEVFRKYQQRETPLS